MFTLIRVLFRFGRRDPRFIGFLIWLVRGRSRINFLPTTSGFAFCVRTRPLSVVVQRKQRTDLRDHASQVLGEEGVLDRSPHP